MKRFLLLIGFLTTLVGCSDDIEFNEQAFQVVKDSEFWKAVDFSATVNDDGFISIVGVSNDQTITLYLNGSEPGTYALGVGSNNTAWFSDANGKGFTTEYRGDGEVTIEKYDPIDQTFNGRFNFNAFSLDNELANFSMGIFYRVPMITKAEVEDLSQLKATVDDTLLVAEEISVIAENGMIEVSGEAADGSQITINLPESVPVGSHNLNEQSASGTYALYAFPNGTTSLAQYGTLNIVEHDVANGMIKGTFSFTTLLPNSASVENGSFTAYY